MRGVCERDRDFARRMIEEFEDPWLGGSAEVYGQSWIERWVRSGFTPAHRAQMVDLRNCMERPSASDSAVRLYSTFGIRP